MLIDLEKLIGLRAVTKAGDLVGKIDGLIFETDGQAIHQYRIKPAGFGRIFDHCLLVNRAQVIDITENSIIVNDNIVREADSERLNEEKGTEPAKQMT